MQRLHLEKATTFKRHVEPLKFPTIEKNHSLQLNFFSFLSFDVFFQVIVRTRTQTFNSIFHEVQNFTIKMGVPCKNKSSLLTVVNRKFFERYNWSLIGDLVLLLYCYLSLFLFFLCTHFVLINLILLFSLNAALDKCTTKNKLVSFKRQ